MVDLAKARPAKLTFELSVQMRRAIEELAHGERRTLSGMIRELIRRGLSVNHGIADKPAEAPPLLLAPYYGQVEKECETAKPLQPARIDPEGSPEAPPLQTPLDGMPERPAISIPRKWTLENAELGVALDAGLLTQEASDLWMIFKVNAIIAKRTSTDWLDEWRRVCEATVMAAREQARICG